MKRHNSLQDFIRHFENCYLISKKFLKQLEKMEKIISIFFYFALCLHPSSWPSVGTMLIFQRLSYKIYIYFIFPVFIHFCMILPMVEKQFCLFGKIPGGRLNIKMPSYQYRDSHVKDKTVSPTVFSLTWESPYLGKTVFILRWGPVLYFSNPDSEVQISGPSRVGATNLL